VRVQVSQASFDCGMAWQRNVVHGGAGRGLAGALRGMQAPLVGLGALLSVPGLAVRFRPSAILGGACLGVFVLGLARARYGRVGHDTAASGAVRSASARQCMVSHGEGPYGAIN